MAFDFKTFCGQDCIHRAKTGTDLHGKATYGDDVVSECRLQEELQITRGNSGDLIVSDATLYFPPDSPIKVDDQVEFDGWLFRVSHVGRKVGLDWVDHLKVMLERGRRG